MQQQSRTLRVRSCTPVPVGGRVPCPLGTLTFPVPPLPAGSAEGLFGGFSGSALAAFGGADCGCARVDLIPALQGSVTRTETCR